MEQTSLGSILLASTDPAGLGAWYADTLSPQEDADMDGYRVLKFGDFYLMIDSRDDVTERNPEPGRMILNFEVGDARAVANQLNERGATWLAELEDRDGSLFATVLDPDGNYVQIIQMSEEQRAAMAAKPAADGAA